MPEKNRQGMKYCVGMTGGIDISLDKLDEAQYIFRNYGDKPKKVISELEAYKSDHEVMLDIMILIGDEYLHEWAEGALFGEDTSATVNSLYELVRLYLEKYKFDNLPQRTAVLTQNFIADSILGFDEINTLNMIFDSIDFLQPKRRELALKFVNNGLNTINLYIVNQILPVSSKIGSLYMLMEDKIATYGFVEQETRDTFSFNKQNYDIISLYHLNAPKEDIIASFRRLRCACTEQNRDLCDYYTACYLFDVQDYSKCSKLLKGLRENMKKSMPLFNTAIAEYLLAFCEYVGGNREAAKLHANEAKELFPRICPQYLQTLQLLEETYYYFKDAKAHNKAVEQLLESHMCFHGEKDPAYLSILLDTGLRYHSLGNIYASNKHFTEAKRLVEKFYGENSVWMDYFGWYEMLISITRNEFAAAKEQLDKAYHVVKSFDSIDTTDEFTFNTTSNKDLILKELSTYAVGLSAELDEDEEYANFLEAIPTLLSGGIDEARRIALKWGLSEDFFQKVILEDASLKPIGIKGIMRLTRIFFSSHKLLKMGKTGALEKLSNADKLKYADNLLETFDMWHELFDEKSTMYTIIEDRLFEMAEVVCEGYLSIDRPDRSLAYLRRFEKSDKTAAGELYFAITKCIIYDALDEQNKLDTALTDFLVAQKNLVSQLISIDSEAKQLEFLQILYRRHTLQKALYLVFKYRSIMFSYMYLLSNKVLSLDYVHLSRLYKKMPKKDIELFYKQIFEADYSSIRSSLAENTALVEYTKICQASGVTKYCAFILSGNRDATLIELGYTELIDGLIERFVKLIKKSFCIFPPEKFYEYDGYRQLRQFITAPIAENIGLSIKKLIVAPEGKFFMLPFELFFRDIFKNIHISYVYSGKDLLRETTVLEQVDIRNSLVIGNLDLIGSSYETDAVSKIMHCPSYVGGKAKKELLNESYDLIHISTHVKIDQDAKDIMSDAQLILTKSETISAKEISFMDFSKAQLVVLSGCRTGEGVKKDFEGLWGISRAFINAGVRNLIVSLWDLDDFATSLLMKRFYINWIEKKQPINIALKNSKEYLKDLTVAELQTILEDRDSSIKNAMLQKELEKIDGKAKYYDHPYYWASLINISFSAFA